MEREITDKQEELLGAFQDSVEWLSHAEIAERLHKTRLNPHETTLLNTLAEAGYLERSEALRGIRQAIVYRSKGVNNG